MVDIGQAEFGGIERYDVVIDLDLALDLDHGVGCQHGGYHLVRSREEQDLDRCLQVLNGDHCPDISTFGCLASDVGDHSRDSHRRVSWTVVGKQLPNADVAFGSKDVLEALQRMVADIEAEHL